MHYSSFYRTFTLTYFPLNTHKIIQKYINSPNKIKCFLIARVKFAHAIRKKIETHPNNNNNFIYIYNQICLFIVPKITVKVQLSM